MNELRRDSMGISYVMFTAVAVLSTWIIHELAHWSAGELLGNNMAMTLNTSYSVSPQYERAWHPHIISAAGPLITLLEAIAFYFLIRKTENRLFFPFLLTCLYMRSLAGFMNLINLNDEGRISQALGLGAFTIPLIVFGILFYLTFDTIRSQSYKTKLVLVTVLLIMFFSSILILSDQVMRVTIISG